MCGETGVKDDSKAECHMELQESREKKSNRQEQEQEKIITETKHMLQSNVVALLLSASSPLSS